MNIEDALPLLVFLVVSFLAFYFVETVIMLTLNYCIRKHWKFVVDRLLRMVVKHRSMMRIASFGVIALIIILLFLFTSLADLLVAGTQTGVMRFLALILITAMVMIYYIGSQSMSEVVIARRIHLFVFVILSLFSFTGIMTVARDGYTVYEDAINAAFVKPIVLNIEGKYEERLENRLVEIFREDVKNGECEYYDYANSTGSGITQFVFIKNDPLLAEESPEVRAKGEPLAGLNCIHQTKFLLTPNGKWYEVLEQSFE